MLLRGCLAAVAVVGSSLFATPVRSQQTLRVEQPDAAALRAAVETMAKRRADGDTKRLTLRLPAGTYAFRKPLELSPEVVGEGLTLRADEPHQVIFSGGQPLVTANRDSDGHWRFPLPADGDQLRRPRVLVVDGKLRPAARFPAEGYLRIERAMEDRRSGFVAQPNDLPSELAATATLADLVLLHDWSSSRLPVASYDASSRTLRTVGPIGCEAPHYAIDHFEAQPRYWLEGHPIFAVSAGDWYFDSETAEVVVIRGEADDTAPSVLLPRMPTILQAGGKNGTALTQLNLEGITFTAALFPMPPGGLAAAQATMHEPRAADGSRTTGDRPMLAAAVQIEQAEGCRVSNCRFTALGGTALWIGSRTRSCVVEDCSFDDIGGNAVNLGEDNSRRVAGDVWYRAAPEQVPTANQVVRCTITRCGQVLPGAVAIWAALQRRLEIAHNTIRDCPYTGISLGWIWDDSPSPAGENHLHHNRIESVMQVLSDGGGIYTLGRQPGSRLEDNHIADVPTNAGRAESNGMFLDQGSSGFLIRGNTILNVAKSPLRFHQAGENVVRGNRWKLATPETPPVRYNNTPEANITVEANKSVDATN